MALTLGLAYLLPNEYRGTAESLRNGRGTWSHSLTFCVLVSLVSALVGAIFGFLPITGGPLLGSALSMAGLLSMGILCAQVGRATGRLHQAVVGAVAAPLPPVVWVVGYWGGLSTTGTNRWSAVACVAAAALMSRSLRHGTLRPHAIDKEVLRSSIGRAGPLVPHLICFGLVIQGIRVTSWDDTSSELLLSHQLMLCASIGFTLLASFNSLFSVTMQTSEVEEYHGSLSSHLRRYAIVGAASCLFVIGTATYVVHRDGSSTGTEAASIPAFLALATANVTFYYSLSAQFLRRASTKPIALSSSVTLVLFVGAMLVDGGGITHQLGAYAAATFALPAVLLCCQRAARAPRTHTLSTSGAIIYVAAFSEIAVLLLAAGAL
ncbi:hypothetical protein [Aeromicrobium sp. 9AM]|uniref:hypothetical protein n=1 Tax=Aeromicrobium sp. 9AM TaxID=2653126 RepID=UPI00135816A2|nr:hypothetical protein [Aeromicrobium sp. 9AM]